MKTGEQITIKKPGLLNGLTGTIVAIRYEVILKDMGTFYLASDEIVHMPKENALHVIKTPQKDGNFDIQKDVYKALTEAAPIIEAVTGKELKIEVVKTKRAYSKRDNNKPPKEKRKYVRKIK